MQTILAETFSASPEGREAEAILRSCVHCGFCTATCPTYQLLGDELDGPRGRIYLIKQALEGRRPTRTTQLHLDRCLTCRSCETTCPSGVRYGRLADIGRQLLEQRVRRPLTERLLRRALRFVLPQRRRFGALLRLGRLAAPMLPKSLRSKLPSAQPADAWVPARHPRRVLVLEGCVQALLTPNTNAAAAKVLDRFGITLVRTPAAGCCGALSHHLGATEEALAFMRRNIDAWWPEIEAGAEAVLVTASGCATVVKEYGDLLKRDPWYGERAARVAALARDPSELLRGEDWSGLPLVGRGRRVAFHSPCTLQHGQRVVGAVEPMLEQLGFHLTRVADAHLCCGSAGTYSILQPEISRQLLADKLQALQGDGPDLIATANVGCQLQLASAARVPVKHWLELLAEAL
jgi:glycolate oxidase iron-sulfur subunit